MDENEQETSLDIEEATDVEDETATEEAETTDEESPQALKARLKRAEKKIEKMKLDAKVEKKVEKVVEKKTGGLDENALDFLDVKGYTEAEDIKVIEDIVKKTGMTVREALKDDYVISKLASNKAQREVKDATPSVTKRGGSQGTDLAAAIARYEQSGYKELPKDFALKSAVINAIAAKSNPNKPSWHD